VPPYALYAPSGKWNATGGRKVFLAPTQQATRHHFALSALYISTKLKEPKDKMPLLICDFVENFEIQI
jgi:hypothetical protein